MRPGIVLLLLTVLSINVNAQADKGINSFISDSLFRSAGISICFRDIESGDILAAHNENMAVTSASVLKLVTTGTALEILGPDFTYKTRVGYVGDFSDGTLKGHIIIKGGGDPTLGSEYFEEHYAGFIDQWAKSIYDSGIRRVEGRVIGDASLFRYHPAAPDWSWGDLGNYYGAGVHGISLFDNTFRIHFKTGNRGNTPQITYIEPEIPGLTINNLLTARGNSDKGYLYMKPYDTYAEIRGTIPENRDDFILKGSIPDPPYLLAILLQNRLEELGIEITNDASTLRLYGPFLIDSLLTKKVVTWTTESPRLSEIISTTNRESVNMFAETLAWTIGYVGSGSESAYLSEGLASIVSYLESSRIETDGLFMTDGSGLSRADAISSGFITSFLVYMSEYSKHSKYFLNSLAEPGTPGTIETYFRDEVFRNNLKAKSGTSTRVRNYAGYLTTSSGRRVSFAILSNNFDCSSSEVTSRVEVLLKDIYERY